jgi:hypothetical protein
VVDNGDALFETGIKAWNKVVYVLKRIYIFSLVGIKG